MGDQLQTTKKIGVWISGKKSQKLDWKEFTNTCNKHGYQLVKMDLEKPFDEQESIDVFLHKLTDIIAAADQGDPKASSIINQVQQYLSNHPEITVIDPLDRVRILLNRYHYYTILDREPTFEKNGIFTPSFVEFTSNCVEDNMEMLRHRGVNFPIICKPTGAHGSKLAHEMIVIFNKKGLRVCKPPCVVQSFIRHNAVLHKVYLIGKRYYICERPSLKNFYASDYLEPIFYTTGEVCKADSQSTLSILDPDDQPDIKMTPDEDKIKHIIRVLRKEIGLTLAGFDFVIDNESGRHAVIDINVYPSYDNFPNFFEDLLDCIDETVMTHNMFRNENGEINSIFKDDEHRFNGLTNVSQASNDCSIKATKAQCNLQLVSGSWL